MKVFDFFRSSAAYRLRIALNLKGLHPEREFVHLRKNEQRSSGYLALNAQGFVPVLVTDGGDVLTQSLSIIEYLDETRAQPPLLPSDPAARARVRSLALQVACDIHPLNNLRVLSYLTGTLGVSEEQKNAWYKYWVDVGLEGLEIRLSRDAATGRFCHGESPTLADICLIPQIANARRFAIDVEPYPTLTRIEAACNGIKAFADAAPALQPDAE
ncbi:MAG: maleylacetoacetate isomerase [Casimicrobiaceae bacterium]